MTMGAAGLFVAVVGPSGVGKDSVMEGLAAKGGYHLVRRVITRPADQGGEDFDHLPPDAFDAAAKAGACCLHWSAHGLSYGIPAHVRGEVAAGGVFLANLSRAALGAAADIFANMIVLNLTASPHILAARLAGRGRESKEVILKRLARRVAPFDPSLKVFDVPNDGALSATITAADRLIQEARGK